LTGNTSVVTAIKIGYKFWSRWTLG
jgi:hypothetical protein